MRTFRLVSTLVLLVLTAPALAGVGAAGCDDLGGIGATPAVDFDTQIEPILAGCASCHGEFGPADLDLRAGEAYDNLVGVTSTTNAERLRVEPFQPESSALFLAVACDAPGGPGFRMPGTTPDDRALIRDWIAQGARAEPALVAVPVNDGRVLVALAILLLLLAGRRLYRESTA